MFRSCVVSEWLSVDFRDLILEPRGRSRPASGGVPFGNPSLPAGRWIFGNMGSANVTAFGGAIAIFWAVDQSRL